MILTETLLGGQAWSRRLARGQILRLTDTTGRACVSALFYNARDPIERYNMADTLKAQYTAFLTVGRVLYSDMGRVLASIIQDSCGWHDTISGCGEVRVPVERDRIGQCPYAPKHIGQDGTLVQERVGGSYCHLRWWPRLLR